MDDLVQVLNDLFVQVLDHFEGKLPTYSFCLVHLVVTSNVLLIDQYLRLQLVVQLLNIIHVKTDLFFLLSHQSIQTAPVLRFQV